MMVQNTIWSIVQQIGSKSLGMISIVGIARIIGPAEFGLAAAALVLIGIAELLATAGMIETFVVGKAVNRKQLDSVVCFVSFLTIGILVLFYFKFYRNIEFVDNNILTISYILFSFGLIFNVISQIAIALLRRKSAFNTLAKQAVAAGMIAMTLGLVSALTTQNAISLSIHYMIGSLILMLLGIRSTGWRPSLVVDWNLLVDYYKNCIPIAAFRVLEIGYLRLLEFVVGKSSGSEDLAHLSISFRLQSVFMQVCSGSIGSVFLSRISSCGYDANEKQKTFILISLLASFITAVPLFIGGLYATWIITFILGVEWVNAGLIFRNICFAGLFVGIYALNSWYFIGVNYPRANVIVSLVKVFVVLILVLQAKKMDAVHVSEAIVYGAIASSLTSYLLMLYKLRSLSVLLPPFMITAILAVFYNMDLYFGSILPIYFEGKDWRILSMSLLLIFWFFILVISSLIYMSLASKPNSSGGSLNG